MTNITLKKTNSAEFKQAEAFLIKMLASKKSYPENFIQQLLSPAERIMLVKRFAAVWMFANNYSQYKVWNTLYISPATAGRIYRHWQNGQYENLVQDTSKKHSSEILNLIHDFITAQAEPKARARLVHRALKN